MGGKGCDMMLIIFPSNEKKRHERGLSYSPRKSPRNSRKELGNPCPMTRRKKCQTIISQDRQQKMFQSYWKIGNVKRAMSVHKQ